MTKAKDDKQFDFRKATIGESLVYIGVINEEQLKASLKKCDPDQHNLTDVLISSGYTTEEKILKAISIRLHVPYLLNFDGILDPGVAKLIPEALARKHLIVPINRSDDVLTIGMANPLDVPAVDELISVTGLQIKPVATTLNNLFATIQKVYASVAKEEKPAGKAPAKNGAGVQAEESSVIEDVNSLLYESIARRASDIHLEPTPDKLRVRYRVDGVLYAGKTFPKELEAAVVARIKLLAKLDITETRLSQDGHLRFDYGKRSIDVRVSTMLTVHGEKVVLRLLDTSQALRTIEELDISPENQKGYLAAISKPNGIVLVTGPTGSGKTTTLYATLARLNEVSRNIVTLENPVEYRIDGLNQVETHDKIGLTFASGLRTILRQDPNIILVGEIRDIETAETAMQAAVTGHLVFSTLHTNDAVSAIHRLLDMDVEPFLLAAALRGILAQRLLRRLCDHCKRPQQPGDLEVEALGAPVDKNAAYYVPVGCDRCGQTGYFGRIGIHEWLNIDAQIRRHIMSKSSHDEALAAAKAGGMVSLYDDAMAKAKAGLSSLAEVIRVTRQERSG